LIEEGVIDMALSEENNVTVETTPLKPIKKQKVLIADDDQATRMMLKVAITQWGYEVCEASNGAEAWEMIKIKDGPRLLILDWLMPEMDGIALCSRIKQELSFHPYIILLTQLAGVANIIKALEAGADEFLTKPFNMAELRSRLAVGSRIVEYEKSITEKNKLLEMYAEDAKTLTTLVLEISQDVYSLFTKKEFVEGNNSVLNEKVKDLQKKIEDINTVIKKIQ
jgi:DNA-binding response OmpR family regulator